MVPVSGLEYGGKAAFLNSAQHAETTSGFLRGRGWMTSKALSDVTSRRGFVFAKLTLLR
jgi:hypothetical protein